MAVSRKQEERALSADEWKLVQISHHPQVQQLSDAELRDLLKTVRERRDRAQSEAHRKRREMRGKAAPKGTQPATKDRRHESKTRRAGDEHAAAERRTRAPAAACRAHRPCRERAQCARVEEGKRRPIVPPISTRARPIPGCMP